MTERFNKSFVSLDSVCLDGFAITPSNTSVFTQPTRAVYVGSEGDLTVQMIGYNGSNTVLTFSNVPAGAVLPIRVQRVYENSTASALVGIF